MFNFFMSLAPVIKILAGLATMAFCITQGIMIISEFFNATLPIIS